MIIALSGNVQSGVTPLEAFALNLTKDERQAGKAVGPKRTPFVIDYFTNKNDYPNLKPPFMNETQANAHWALRNNLMNTRTKTAKLLEMLDDIILNSEHFAYEYALEGYHTVQRGKEQNVPGADTFYDMLRTYFENMGSDTGTDPEGPADPPAPPAPDTPIP